MHGSQVEGDDPANANYAGQMVQVDPVLQDRSGSHFLVVALKA